MGILNVTPDSFSGDGCLRNGKISADEIVARAQAMISDGADIIDVGGESTRPGAQRISTRQEIDRVIPVIKQLRKCIKKPISIDTYKLPVAERALDSGASIVNNIMGVTVDNKFLRVVKKHNAAIVLMHIRGTPRTMQTDIFYENLMEEIISELQKSMEKCLEIGIKSDRIIIDPGIGFGKTAEHNLVIINRLGELRILGHPILIGTSRKSFIGKVLNKEPQDRLFGTAASISMAIKNGAHIVRVHDVNEIKDVVTITDAIINERIK